MVALARLRVRIQTQASTTILSQNADELLKGVEVVQDGCVRLHVEVRVEEQESLFLKVHL